MITLKIGLPKALYYYYFHDFYEEFFKQLGVTLVISDDTNRDIISTGTNLATDEMCLSLKILLGHIASLQGKCDYILLPMIYNYGRKDQMCCNFMCLYDVIHTIIDIPILDYEINYEKRKNEYKGMQKIGKILGFSRREIKKAYKIAKTKANKKQKQKILENVAKLNSTKKKVLMVSHSYNNHDPYIGGFIKEFLENQNCEVIDSDAFDNIATNLMSRYLSRELYWKYEKENIGSIVVCQDKIDGIVFLTTFPCGLDSLVNELVIRKISLPYLNLVMDDLDSTAGIETRLESFIDMINQEDVWKN